MYFKTLVSFTSHLHYMTKSNPITFSRYRFIVICSWFGAQFQAFLGGIGF